MGLKWNSREKCLQIEQTQVKRATLLSILFLGEKSNVAHASSDFQFPQEKGEAVVAYFLACQTVLS